MRSPSIEWFHAKIDKQIRLASSYTEIPELEFVIKSCRLKPYDYVFKERDNTIVLHKWWFDEFGNSLSIDRNKRIKITCNDLRLDKKKIIGTDLYQGLTLDRIVKMSRLVHVVFGKDEDLYQDCALVSFLGIDEHLRSYLYWYGEWHVVSPLIMGMPCLKNIANHQDIKYFHRLGNKENSAIPCVSGQAWLSCLPASPAFLSEINKHSEMLASILT
jgi:hypothetical protein